MRTATKQTATRPFHETIVEAIRQASSRELECLATLIKATKIPKGHDEIIAAWNERRKGMCWGDEDLGVPANLLEQKQAHTKNSGDGKRGIKLDDLQLETERLLALLKDRQPGLMTWHGFLHESLQSLYELTSRALDK